MESPSDEQLILALRGGDTDCLGLLVSRWERPLLRFVSRMIPRPEDARDLCQETFLRVLGKADRFREGSRFSTWLYQIALNLCRDHRRRRRRWLRIVSDTDELPERAASTDRSHAADDPSRGVERNEVREQVRRALERIPAEQREVLILKEYEGLKFREIAEILGCPESTVKSRLYYGLDGMRQAMVRQGVSRHKP